MRFDDLLVIIGAEPPEAERALGEVAASVWREVDEAMGELWVSETERKGARAEFAPQSLFEIAQSAGSGVITVRLDIDSDTAAEVLSAEIEEPVLAIRRYEDEWCRIHLYLGGRSKGWLFWAADEWLTATDGEVTPALASAARSNGGWVGSPKAFEPVLDRGARVADIKRLLKEDFSRASAFVTAFLGLCGAPLPSEATA